MNIAAARKTGPCRSGNFLPLSFGCRHFWTAAPNNTLQTGQAEPQHDISSRIWNSMLILGLNMFHADASAAIIRDGEVVFAIAEERLNRVKHYAGFPSL